MRLVYFVIVSVFAFQATSCTSSSKTTDEAAQLPTNVEAIDPTEEPTQAPAFNAAQRAALSFGHLTVFGLALPRGMTPLNGPDKVYRFEGNQSCSLVFEDLKKQIQSRRIVPEGSGHLIREASVIHPEGNATGDELIAMRIKKRIEGGTILDLWLETESSVRQNSSRSTYSRSAVNPNRKTVKTTATAWKRNRAKTMHSLLQTMELLEKGETMTAEEMQSAGLD